MNTQHLNKNELNSINGCAADRSVKLSATTGADSLLSFTSKSTKGNDTHKTSFTAGNGFSLSLLGLKSNYNEY
jgi:hypothetical protein